MSPVRVVACLFIAMATVWVLPKVRLHLATPGITTNNWSGEIHYKVSDLEVADGSLESGDLYCVFFSHDSSPYWEGSYRSQASTGIFNHNEEIERLCERLPRWLFSEGFPPRTLAAGVEAPAFFGRIF